MHGEYGTIGRYQFSLLDSFSHKSIQHCETYRDRIKRSKLCKDETIERKALRRNRRDDIVGIKP